MSTNSVMAAFASFTAMDKVEADHGEKAGGYEWPEDGTHMFRVLEIRVEEGDYGKQGSGVAGTVTWFKFQPISTRDPATGIDVDRAEDKQKPFIGERFRLPKDPSKVTDPGQKMAMEIALKRLRGHIEVITGQPCPANLAEGLAKTEKVLNSGNDVLVMGKTATRVDKKRVNPKTGKNFVNQTEYLSSLVSN